MLIETNLETELEDDLAALLDELTNVQDELLSVLASKRACVAKSDLDGMLALQTTEEELGARLQSCHDRRGALLASARERGLACETLGQLSAHLPANRASEYGRQIAQTSARMRLLQHESLTNWVLAQKSLLHLSQLLEIIATGGRGKPTYSKGTAAREHGSLVDESV